MRYLTLKVTENPRRSYRDLILQDALPSPAFNAMGQPVGTDIGEMSRRMQLFEVVDRAKDGEVVELGEADWEKLCAIVNAPIWNGFSLGIYQFIKDVNGVSRIDPVAPVANGHRDEAVPERVMAGIGAEEARG